MVGDVVALMNALGHDRFAVVGHDCGSRVVCRAALDHGCVDRLCAIDIVPSIEQLEALSASRWSVAVLGSCGR